MLLISTLLSCFVFLFAKLANRKKWLISTRPEYWLTCLIVCFIPFLPMPTFSESSHLPDVLQLSPSITSIIQEAEIKVFHRSVLELNTIGSWFLTVLALISFYGLYRFSSGLIKTWNIILKSEHLELTNFLTKNQIVSVKKYNITIRLTNSNISPFSFGLLNSYLILPGFILKLPETQVRLLIDHEINHIVRNDHRLLLAVKLIVRLFKFNPIFKWMELHYINSM